MERHASTGVRGCVLLTGRVIGVFVICWLVVLLVASASVAAEDTRPLQCGDEITDAGSYQLNTDSTSSEPCLNISTSDVIVDGFGFEQHGTGTGTGITVADPAGETVTNVTVRNVTLSNWSVGIAFDTVTAGTISDVDAIENDRGILITEGNQTVIRDNSVNDSVDHAIAVTGSSVGTTVEGNVVSDNGGAGIYVEQSDDTLLRNNILMRSEYGFHVHSSTNTTSDLNTIYHDSTEMMRVTGGATVHSALDEQDDDSLSNPIGFEMRDISFVPVDSFEKYPENRTIFGMSFQPNSDDAYIEFELGYLRIAEYIDDQTLGVYTYNDTTTEWDRHPQSTVDREQFIVSVTETSAQTIGIFADPIPTDDVGTPVEDDTETDDDSATDTDDSIPGFGIFLTGIVLAMMIGRTMWTETKRDGRNLPNHQR